MPQVSQEEPLASIRQLHPIALAPPASLPGHAILVNDLKNIGWAVIFIEVLRSQFFDDKLHATLGRTQR